MNTILPIVNNNGTSRNELIQQRRNVVHKIDDALYELRQMYPHGRDYQTDKTGEVYPKAREQHERRLKVLTELQNELKDEALALYQDK